MIILDPTDHSEYKNCSLVNEAGNLLMPYQMVIHPNWKEKGIENELLQFIEQSALLNRYTSMHINALPENK